MAHGREQPFDHVALGGHQHHALARAGGSVDDAKRVEVHDCVVERHRHLVLGLEGDRCGEFLLIGDRGQLSVRSTVRWLATPTRTRLLSPLDAEQLAQRLAERALVDHFSVAHRVGRERQAGGLLGDDRAVDPRPHGRDEARLDVQPDDVRARAGGRGLTGSFRLSEGICISDVQGASEMWADRPQVGVSASSPSAL